MPFKENRMKPQVPSFSKTPANIIDPAVGASTCASGNQRCIGKDGTLLENEIKKLNQINFFALTLKKKKLLEFQNLQFPIEIVYI